MIARILYVAVALALLGTFSRSGSAAPAPARGIDGRSAPSSGGSPSAWTPRAAVQR